jgi:ABC-type multidrug transport system ATPase subunit
MNEFILNALLQLFAIIANVSEDGISFKARNIVKSYLSKHLSSNLIRKYLRLFDDYLRIHHPDVLGEEGDGGKTTLSDSQKLTEIGKAINRNLLQREKFIVFLRLVEFINEDEVMTKKELDFIRTVANTFNISDTEQINIREFVLDSLFDEIQPDKLLILDKDDKSTIPDVMHIHVKDMEGRIVILRHASTNTFIFRYSGDSTLYLNGYNIIPGKIELLEQGAMVTGHKINPIYYSDVANRFHHSAVASKVHFVVEDLEFQFKNSSKGIKKFSFEKESGHLIGIMGGSGVGKSTLINLLSGKLKPLEGRITINGIDIQKEPDKIQGLVGFVPQDDLLLEELSVFENLYFNAKLCLDHFTEREILRRVEEILIDLELDEAKHLKVGNPLKKFISGGQRKRLNIALELIREPGVLFVDEPTSGLSSHDSEKVMLLLKEQALKGRLVIVNIHQPFSDIYKLFDQIMILDKGGYVIYKGNPIDAIVYFKTLSNYVDAEEGHCHSCGNVMSEEILQIVEAREVNEYGKLTKERKVEPEEWYSVYKEKIESQEDIRPREGKLPDIDFKVPRAFSQFRVFVARNILSKLANRQYLLVNFLEAPLLAMIIGYFTKFISEESSGASYVFMENVNLPVYLFMSVVVALFMGLMVSAEEIIRDKKILERESFLRLSWLSYIHSKIFVLFIISAIQTLSFVLVGNLILEIKGMFLSYWLILFTTSCLANMIGLNLSAGLNSVITIYIIIPFILVPQLLFSGFTVNYDKLHKIWRNPEYVPVIGDMMTSRWAYEALAVDQFKDNRFTRNFYAEDRVKRNAAYHQYILNEVQKELDNTNFAILKDSAHNAEESFNLIKAELTNLSDQGIIKPFNELDRLEPIIYNQEVYSSAINFLKREKKGLRVVRKDANARSELISAALQKELGGKDAYLKLEADYYNKRLAELLSNERTTMGYAIKIDNRFVRKRELIYMEPLSKFGRAHFYAPVKKLGGLTIDTYLFNFLFIWVTALLFYLTLVFDILRRIVTWAEKIKLLKKLKSRY